MSEIGWAESLEIQKNSLHSYVQSPEAMARTGRYGGGAAAEFVPPGPANHGAWVVVHVDDLARYGWARREASEIDRLVFDHGGSDLKPWSAM